MRRRDYLGLLDPDTRCVESVNEVTPEYQVKLLLGVTLLDVTVSLITGQVGQLSPTLFRPHHLDETFRIVVRFNLGGMMIKNLTPYE